MRRTRLSANGWLVVVSIAMTVMLAACLSPTGDPYGAGQQFRELVNALLEDASQFLAGFCGTTPAALLASLATVLYLGKRSS